MLLKEVSLKVNCPECYTNEGLLLRFFQHEKKLLGMFKRIEPVEERLDCQLCETKITPGRWTEDIDRMHMYHLKTITSQKSGLKFLGVFYAVLVLLLFLVLGLVYFLEF